MPKFNMVEQKVNDLLLIHFHVDDEDQIDYID